MKIGISLERNMEIECQICAWTGEEEDLVAPHSEDEACCPICGSTDFLDSDEADALGNDADREMIGDDTFFFDGNIGNK